MDITFDVPNWAWAWGLALATFYAALWACKIWLEWKIFQIDRSGKLQGNTHD